MTNILKKYALDLSVGAAFVLMLYMAFGYEAASNDLSVTRQVHGQTVSLPPFPTSTSDRYPAIFGSTMFAPYRQGNQNRSSIRVFGLAQTPDGPLVIVSFSALAPVQFLAEGDTYEGWTVVQIDEEDILLSSASLKQRIPFLPLNTESPSSNRSVSIDDGDVLNTVMGILDEPSDEPSN